MFSLYRWLLYLYPRAHHNKYGEEMMAVFLEARREVWKKGVAARGGFCVREIGGLLCGALQEHVRTITASYRQWPLPSGRCTMHSEFRFPKATPSLMAIILAVVVVAIEKAKAIQASMFMSRSNPHLGPIKLTQLTPLPSVTLMLIVAYIAGVIGWGLFFGWRRSKQ